MAKFLPIIDNNKYLKVCWFPWGNTTVREDVTLTF